MRVRERAPDEGDHSAESLGREKDRLIGRARSAHRAPGSRQIADELADLSALDAALQMRDVAGEPQQLELEGEREWIERGTTSRAGRQGVDSGEESRERLERALVLLLLDEEAQHRLGADEPDREPVGILARRAVRVDERDAGDGVELSRALVQQQLDVRERLEPSAEPRLRLADRPSRSRRTRPRSSRVHVEDAVGLAVAKGAEHHCLRLDRPPHADKSRLRRRVGACVAHLEAAGSAGRTTCRDRRRASS